MPVVSFPAQGQLAGDFPIGGLVGGGTQGSILFVGGGGLLGQNNASLFWDSTLHILKADNAQFKGSPWFDVKQYGAKGDGVTDDTTAIQAALNAVDSTYGGVVFCPSGKYIFSAPLVINKNTTLMGAGRLSTLLSSAHTGDGIQSTWPINSSTEVCIKVIDLELENTNGSNTGGGFVDVGGTDLTIKGIRVHGFAYGVIFDQTELGDIVDCDFQFPLTAGIWIANGPDHTGGASVGFTNRITVCSCQFNGTPGTGIAIIDDGGTAHSFVDNNYNGFLNHMRIAGAFGCAIRGGEFEAATGTNIIFSNLSKLLGTGVGASISVTLGHGASISPAAGQSCVSVTSLSDILYDGVYFGNTTAVKVASNANCNTAVAARIWNAGGGATFSGKATRHFELDGSIGGVGSAIMSTNFQIACTQFGNIGTTTDAAAQGDFSFGITGAKRATYLASGGTFSLYDANNVLGCQLDAVNKRLFLNGPAGSDRAVQFQTAGVNRWLFDCNSGAEGGSNAGSNFEWDRYNDAGTLLATAFFITRSNGFAGINTPAPSNLWTVNQAANATRATPSTYGFALNNQGTTNLTLGSDGTNALIQSFGGAPLWINNQGNDVRIFGGNIGFFGVSAVPRQTRGATFTNNITAGGTTDSPANWTDLTTYANDAAAIRNFCYQVARVLNIYDTGIRNLGLFT